MRLRRFTDDDVAVAQFLVAQAERRLEVVGDADDRAPAARRLRAAGRGAEPRGPRTR